MNTDPSQQTRRKFLRQGALFLAAGYSAPLFLKRTALALDSVVSSAATKSTAGMPAIRTNNFPFDRFLKEYNVWECHPLDQGARLVQLQLVGSEKDADTVAALRRPDFFAPWGEPIQWNRLESTEIEKSAWLNRWYYLPCFARMYWLTGDRAYLDDLLKLFRRWTTDNPVPADLPAYFRSRQGIWRDMQVAWRVQNLTWSFFLGREGFTSAEQQELSDSIATHAQVAATYFGGQTLSPGNHQSHGALAMLEAAILFPELANADAIQANALKILNWHLEAAFSADGNSVEFCPGYYPFMVANFRDAYLLCTSNGIPLSSRWRERLAQFHNFIRQTQQPDGTTPPINDSTEVPVRPSLRIFGAVLGLADPDQPPTTSVRFADSNQAVMRDGGDGYLFVDAAAGVGSLSHWHGGKLGFHYWRGERPYLVDSGICNYNDPLRRSWYATSQAHNTILVDGLGDLELQRQHSPRQASEVGSRLTDWQSTAEYDLATMTTRAFLAAPKPVSWTRQILMLKQRFVIVLDRLESSGTHEYRWLFHFTPTTLKEDVSAKRLLTGFDDRNLLLMPFQPALFTRMEVTQQRINKRSRHIPAPVGDFTATAADLVAAFLLLPVSGTEFPRVELQQTPHAEGVSLGIHTGQETLRLLIPHLPSTAGGKSDSVAGPAVKITVEK